MGELQNRIEDCLKVSSDPLKIEELKKKWLRMVGNDWPIMIYGAGLQTAPALLDLLSIMGRQPIAVIDSDSNKWGKMIGQYPISSLDRAKKQFGTQVLVMIAVRGEKESERQINEALQNAGFFQVIPCGEWLPFRGLLGQADYNLMSEKRWEESIGANVDRLEELCGALSDDLSRTALDEIIQMRLSPGDFQFRFVESGYFLNSLFVPQAYNAIVDCGAYRGDTLKEFLLKREDFSAYYAIEMDPYNAALLKKQVAAYPGALRKKITVYETAVGSKDGEIQICADGSVGSHIDRMGSKTVPLTRMDSLFLRKKVSYIKMDIEGAEKDAISGAKTLITRDRPVLAISAYHRDPDLWELPALILSMVSEYRLYLRREGLAEYLLYGVPNEKCVQV